LSNGPKPRAPRVGKTGMSIFGVLLVACWLTFFGYWILAAMRTKPTVGRTWWKGAVFRAALALGSILLVRASLRDHAWGHGPHAVTTAGLAMASIGVALCALGIGLAIWARANLGRNWGLPMSLREGPDLVTTGPYAFVRHPIYSGLLLAFAGTALVQWFPWVVLVAVFFAYFIYAATVEERNMLTQFPNQYPAYMQHTKMIIPFVL
jgi:protein-S-isoprenylcysteine O-methyltransferase Ste14